MMVTEETTKEEPAKVEAQDKEEAVTDDKDN